MDGHRILGALGQVVLEGLGHCRSECRIVDHRVAFEVDRRAAGIVVGGADAALAAVAHHGLGVDEAAVAYAGEQRQLKRWRTSLGK